MAQQTPPYALQAASHSAELFRRAISNLLSSGGVVGANDYLVTQNGTPNMSVNVAGGQVWVQGTIGANQGMYYGLNDATVNLIISAANPTNPRIDQVVVTVNDAAYSGSTNSIVLQVLTGTPTSGATLTNKSGAASVPANSLVLAYVLVPAGTSSIVTADLQDARSAVGLTSGSPPGMMAPYAGGTVPAGWLLCQGQAVSRTTYAKLFAAIGTTWGAGDGSTTFNLPDYRGRTFVGQGTVGTNQQPNINLGQTGGDITQFVSHTHSDQGHNHVLNASAPIGNSLTNYSPVGGTGVAYTTTFQGYPPTSTAYASLANSGTGSTAQQPFAGCYVIIKT